MFLPIIVPTPFPHPSLFRTPEPHADLAFVSVGRPKHTRIMAGAVDGDVFIGSKAQELRGLLKIRYPLEHGIVTDWDDMEKIWSYIYSEELKTLPEEVSYYYKVVVNFSILCC